MPRLLITHTTSYTYRNPVGLMRHRLMVRPLDSHDLRLQEATLAVEPAPSSTIWAHDVFGNSICLLEWPDDLRTTTLRIVSRLDVTHLPSGNALPRATLDPIAAHIPFSYAAAEIPDVSRLTERHGADPEGAVDTWARRFIAQDGPTETMSMLERMTQAVQAEFTYQAREAEGTQSAVQTLALGSGTCRDFALLMMEAVRSLGLAARFVTGYLYDSQSAGLQGGGASHAWCAVYLPGAGWVEYDPTNGLLAGASLIRVGVSRMPEQAVPVGGGYVGDPTDPVSLDVEVAVELVPDPS